MEKQVVGLDRLYGDNDWKEYIGQPMIPIGAETDTHNLVGNLINGFNLLIGGKTGSGKSTFIHVAIANLLKNTNGYDFRFILIDPKRVELSLYYKDLPSLLHPVIWTVEDAVTAFQWCMFEIDRRNALFENEGVFNREEYSNKTNKEMPRVLVVIDEYSDLLEDDFWFFDKAIKHILEEGKTAGINILMGSSKVGIGYTKKMSEYFSYKVAFKTFKKEDSVNILGFEGAEELDGNGDLLLIEPDLKSPARAQGFYMSEDEIKKVVEEYSKENKPFEPQSLLFKSIWKLWGMTRQIRNYVNWK
jgi:S-DNA-T family DNA segregation ATPase FtsK/SpoIIIE